jgi:protein-S-isoprenylcysteine O-methyltransferase Ste14
MTGVTLAPLFFVVVFSAMYLPKALREEAFLRARYGDQYDAYASRVGRFFPQLRWVPQQEMANPWFSWQRVFGHREQLTWLGTAAALALIWAQAVGWLHPLGVYTAEHLPWLDNIAHFVR